MLMAISIHATTYNDNTINEMVFLCYTLGFLVEAFIFNILG